MKNFGANSTSHLGSTAMTLRMYSAWCGAMLSVSYIDEKAPRSHHQTNAKPRTHAPLVVSTNSWYSSHSGFLLNSAEEGWMYCRCLGWLGWGSRWN